MTRESEQRSKAFTLLEVLVSLVVAGTLLGGFALAVDGVCRDLSRIRLAGTDTQYQRAVDLMGADARGIISIGPVIAETGRYGRCLARLVSTHRINAVSDGHWRGTAEVSYWLAESCDAGKSLWRSEAPVGADRSSQTWTCLMDGLADCEIELLDGDGWSSWPKTDDQMEQVTGRISFRLSAVAAAGPRQDLRQLPATILGSIVNVLDDYDSFPKGSRI